MVVLRVITLLTDFGLRDSYVAEMKGVILRLCPEAVVVDISHEISKYDIEEGAYNLARAVRYFPKGTIHVGVVDPGVGGPRKPIIIEAHDALFVGPDNGLLAPAAERLGIKGVYEITRMDLLPPRVSDVFHGRDIFAPTAALLARGLKPSDLGSQLSEYKRLPLYTVKVEDGRIYAKIIHVDGFGNLVTNVTYEDLDAAGIEVGTTLEVQIGGATYRIPFVRAFSSVPVGELLLLVAGGGYLEISVNQGNASAELGVEKGVEVRLSPL
ncbi:SAM-dependent chlorinase/fluorinase [Candidatus Bathyarchaeota archaeon]|nr:SAM-dependent chlorinase/fluorinase [Candidatus Bathyarchaeota archaeon]